MVVKRIIDRHDLMDLADELGMRTDWHEPDGQDVSAKVYGHSFDNAGFWPSHGKSFEEMYVELLKDGMPVAWVNLATLFAWATGLED